MSTWLRDGKPVTVIDCLAVELVTLLLEASQASSVSPHAKWPL